MSSSVRITRRLVIEKSGSTARPSRLKRSSIVSNRTLRLVMRISCMKSSPHSSLSFVGAGETLPRTNRTRRFLRGRTCNRSSQYRRRRRLWFITRPSRLSRILSRRHPNLGRSCAMQRNRSRTCSSPGRLRGLYRTVGRGQVARRHACRWLIPSASNALTASLRAEGPTRFFESPRTSRGSRGLDAR